MSATHIEVGLLWQRARAVEQGLDPELTRQAYERIIALDPLQPAAWLKLSQLALLRGAYRDARASTLLAADATRQSRRWRALPYVAMQLLQFDERALVSGLIAGADWNDEAVLTQAAVLAQRLWLADDATQALALLDHAMRLLPAHHLLHFSRGEVLNQLGCLQDAEAEYLRCLALAPGYSHACLSLVRNQRSPLPGARVPMIRSVRAAAGTPEDRAVLDYALFHELDAAGQAEEAWTALESGARLQRSLGRYDEAAEQAGLRALLESFDGMPPLQHGPVQGPGRAHVFVVGLPRSGTTLLERMFGNHPLVASAGELNVFSRSLSYEIDAFFEPPADAGIVLRALRCDWARVGARYATATAALHPGARYLLDKNPLNIHNAGFIARALPQARILCLSRNPMDACFSNLKELFAPGSYGYSYDQNELAANYARFEQLVACWRLQLPEHFHVVEYEALIDDPPRELARAMAFCGLDFDPAYVDIARNLSPVSTASSAQVREPLNRRGVHAWRTYGRQLQPLAARLRELDVRVD